MAETHVISALVAKRAELSGQCENLEREKAKLRAQIRHIDHSLAIFGYRDPPRDIKPKRPKVFRFARRELSMLLRRFERDDLTNREIALQIMEFKGWNTDDRELAAKVAESVKSAKNWRSRKERRATK